MTTTPEAVHIASSKSCYQNSPKYTHDETATIHLQESANAHLHARVHLESTSTLSSSRDTPLLHDDTLEISATPFSQDILHLMGKYKLHRLIIKVGDRSSSTTTATTFHNDDDNESIQRSMGPAGTSITASFVTVDSSQSNNNQDEYKLRYATLLRYLLDQHLFPPCGAPLDSIRERKHGHTILVRPENNTNVVNVESILAADGSTFCSPDFILKDGWGKYVDGGCHRGDNWGLFNSLFAPPIDASLSDASFQSLSQLLLGSSDDSVEGIGEGDDGRHSMWIEVSASHECFSSGMCIVEVSRGVSYRIGLPSFGLDVEEGTGNEQDGLQFTLSLGDVLLGRNILEQSIEKEGWKAWYPCLLSDSSRVILHLPTGYKAKVVDEETVVEKRLDIDALSWEDGFIDLSEPLATLYRVAGSDAQPAIKHSTFGISRTVQRPLGIAGPGTLVTVLRVDETAPSSAINVEAFDVLPGHLIKPKIQTLQMVLYEGGGAGGRNFVPFGGYDYDICEVENQCGLYNRTKLGLSDLKHYNLNRRSDGTILVDRIVELTPDSSLWMMVDYDEAYLPFQKFPADANRGVDIFPSRATFTPITTSVSPQPSTTLYSPSLLIMPPVPDMSMPFNVISLSCTLWAFVLGSMINILVRRGTESVKREFTGEKEKRPIDKIREKICEKLAKVKALFRKSTGASALKKTDNCEKESTNSAKSQEPVQEKKDN